MKFSGKRILIISPEDWGVNWISKHHYAAQLAERGSHVSFLGPGRVDPEELESPEGVTLLRPPSMPRGLRFYPGPLRRKAYRSIGARLQSEAYDVVWSFDPSRLLDLDALAPRAIRIYHMADFCEGLPWKLVARSADICFGPSSHIVGQLKTVTEHAHFINHGFVDYPLESFGFETPGPNVVYAGSLAQQFIDRERLRTLVEKNRGIYFHFFGDTGFGNLGRNEVPVLVDELRGAPNVTFHGSVPPGRLPSIYQAADALFLCYDLKFGDLVSNSHKVMGYLGSGKPVLSTPMFEYREQADLVRMEAGVEEFCAALSELVRESDEELSRRRREFANQNSYARQLERIEHLIEQRLSASV